MQENIKKINEHNDENSQPKRRIVRHIVRRIPKAKPTTETKEVAESSIPKIIKHDEALHEVLANEKPVYSSIDIDSFQTPPIKEVDGPKEMILKQLGQNKNKDIEQNKISHQSLDSTSKSPIGNIWPYIAASKQQSKVESNFGENNSSDKKILETTENIEHNYFSWIPWILIPLAVTGIVIFGLSYFDGAEVLVTPKVQQVTIASDVVTEKNADQTKTTPLTILIIEDKVTNDVAATESKTTIATASGKVTIFNKQKVVQTLIKTTRLEASDGKIYRIRENVKVPAAVGDKPGTLDVTVYAESAGTDYNKKAGTDFTIPGFKGKPQFQLVYAKSIGDIVGGSSGVKKSVSKESMEELSKNMRIELENKLRGRLSRELLQNQVAYEGLYQFDYKEPVLEASDAPEKARIALTGTLSVPVFDKFVLSRDLAKSTIPEYAGEDVVLNKIEQLTAKLAEGQKVNLTTDSKATFHFEGSGSFTWIVDSKAFTKALLNVSKNDVSRVSKKFSGIDKVTATLNPFWKSYFPGNIDDIKVKIIEAGK